MRRTIKLRMAHKILSQTNELSRDGLAHKIAPSLFFRADADLMTWKLSSAFSATSIVHF
jgi:hypothetical protein